VDIKLLYVDTETSGTDPLRHGVTQLAGEVVINGVIEESFDLRPRLFSPDLVTGEAMEKTGMTHKGIMARPMGPKDAHGAFTEVLGRYVNKFDKRDKFTMVAYNSKFDWDMLQSFFKKCGDDYFGSWFWWPAVCVAILTMDKLSIHNRAKLPNMQLATLANALQLPVDESMLHDACYDIYLTRLLHEMVGTNVPKAVSGPDDARLANPTC
jgi:DNA polymerase-3 subunit epsilon